MTKDAACREILYGGHETRTANGEGKYNSTITGFGFIVPWDCIEGIEVINPPEELWDLAGFKGKNRNNYGLGQRGGMAERLFRLCAERGLIRLPINYEIRASSASEEIKGNDFCVYVDGEAEIQVKCDWKGGKKEKGGTGNMFLQTHESNPNHTHSISPETIEHDRRRQMA